jgi:hypothetical protein
MNQWGGLLTAASRYLIPAGSAVWQENIMSLTPGQLQVRGGMRKLADTPNRFMEMWGLSVGANVTDIILAYAQDGKIHEVTGIGGTATSKEIDSSFRPLTPTSFSQGRRGEVYIFQGFGKRGLVRNTNGLVRQIGVEAPTTDNGYPKPTIDIDWTVRSYVARVDILDAGNGYTQPPRVTIGPPDPGGEQATAIARINDGRIVEIEVTDGGSGYSKPPYVVIDDPPQGPSTGTGVQAVLALENPHPAGDHETGVVYWESYLQGTPLGPTDVTDNGNNFTVTYGVTWCVTTAPTPPAWPQLLEYWAGGLIIPTCTNGSGSGARMWLPLTDAGKDFLWRIFPTLDPSDPSNLPLRYPNPCNLNFPSDWCYFNDEQARQIVYGMQGDLGYYFGEPQVYDFGSGYRPGDEVWAYIHTSSFKSVRSGSAGAQILQSFCGSIHLCPYVFKGYIWGGVDTPDRFTIKAASQARQNVLKPTLANPGSGYTVPPEFETDDGQIIKTEIDPVSGSVTKLIVGNPDARYLWPPTLVDPDGDAGKAQGVAILRANLRGRYQTYYRFVDERVPVEDGGPLYSSLSELTEIDAGDGAGALIWHVPAIPSWATSIELFRSTSNQAQTLFRVARLGGSEGFAVPWTDRYRDELSDWDIIDADREAFLALPIVLQNGALNANRYSIPTGDFAVGTVFQDRLFLGVDTTGKRPNTLVYSEADEPESMPQVNELILQTNLRDSDYITGLVPYSGALIVFQSRHCHRLTYVEEPQSDASVVMLAYRGLLNQRCWDIYEGILYVMDDQGIYSMDEQGGVQNISQQIDDLFRENTDTDHPEVDFAERKWFFVRSDRAKKVIRVHCSFKGDPSGMPYRQLTYSVEHKTWWIETYPELWTAGTEVRTTTGQVIPVVAGLDSIYQLGHGLTDEGTPIQYRYRSGNMEFISDNQRGGDQANPRNVSVTYRPTASASRLNLSLYFNDSDIARHNAVRRDRGAGFTHEEDGPAFLDMILNDGKGDAPAIATALFAGKTLRDFYGNDRFVSIELHGQQDDAGPVAIHDVEVEGVLEKQ